ncbi:MAG TPA: hypothetical protein VKB22_06610 [Gemmatimonadales bacterium]|nr:hypothetical protein [Gemmatimonadales bacterium]
MNRLRLTLALVGLLLAALSVAFDERRLGWVAIVLLAASLLLRLWLRRRTL